MKFTQKMHQSVTFQATSSTCSCLYSFPPKKIENLSSWTSEVVSRVLTKGWRLGGGGVEAGGRRGGGWGAAGWRLGGGGVEAGGRRGGGWGAAGWRLGGGGVKAGGWRGGGWRAAGWRLGGSGVEAGGQRGGGWGVAGRARDRPQNGGRPRLESRHEITGLCWLLSG